MGCLRRTKTDNGRAKPNPMMRRQELDMHRTGGVDQGLESTLARDWTGPGCFARSAGSAEG
jgi:hypothetical protein